MSSKYFFAGNQALQKLALPRWVVTSQPDRECPWDVALSLPPRDHQAVETSDLQRQRLRATIKWAREIRSILGPLLNAHGDQVHFRPGSSGIAMVGLLADRPQRGKSGITNLKRLAEDFEALFGAHCRSVEHGRATGEKALQSFLIREAQQNGQRLLPINTASAATDDPVELEFITDEISLPVESGKIVCDILALRRDGGRCTPVLLELKDSRQLGRLVEQVEGYAKLVDGHADLFAELFGALLGEVVRFHGPTEKWLVWPSVGSEPDPRTEELLKKGIRVVAYGLEERRYSFLVGPGAAASAPRGGTVAEATFRIGSTDDPRVTSLVRIGRGEGFATHTGYFDGRPAFIVDCGTLSDFLDEDDNLRAESVTVRVFDDETAMARYVDDLRRRAPAALGEPERQVGERDRT